MNSSILYESYDSIIKKLTNSNNQYSRSIILTLKSMHNILNFKSWLDKKIKNNSKIDINIYFNKINL